MKPLVKLKLNRNSDQTQNVIKIKLNLKMGNCWFWLFQWKSLIDFIKRAHTVI